MILFSVLWLPCCYALWIKIRPAPTTPSSTRFFERVTAIFTGITVAIVRFFCTEFWHATGFGFSRFLGALIDYGFVPLILPLMLCFVFASFQSLISKKQGLPPYKPDWVGWVLLSLIPVMLVCVIRWGQEKNPASLVLIPLLWSASAFNFFFSILYFAKKPYVKNESLRLLYNVLAIIGIALLSSAVWWAFFRSNIILGFMMLACQTGAAGVFVVQRLKQTVTTKAVTV